MATSVSDSARASDTHCACSCSCSCLRRSSASDTIVFVFVLFTFVRLRHSDRSCFSKSPSLVFRLPVSSYVVLIPLQNNPARREGL
jgi:hypothetical protein